MLRAGYFKMPGNIHMLLRDKCQSALSSNLAKWNLTRGDGVERSSLERVGFRSSP